MSVTPVRQADRDALHRAAASGQPYLVMHDGREARVACIPAGEARLTIGRDETCDVALPWDERVSRTHAVLERAGRTWTLTDDGLSRNGTYLNGERLVVRARLADGDAIRVGRTELRFRHPVETVGSPTAPDDAPPRPRLTAAQRRVLVALCRPYKGGAAFAAPASNATIAEELVVSVDAVKTQMRALFALAGVGDLRQNRKRAKLVELAFESGLVSDREL